MPAIRTSPSSKSASRRQKSYPKPNTVERPNRYKVTDGKKEGALRKKEYDNACAPKEILRRPNNFVAPKDLRSPLLTLHDLECVKTLGQGSFGRVLLVRTKRNTHPLDKPGSLFALKAVKRKNLRNLSKDYHFKDTQRERFSMSCLASSRFIADMVQTFVDSRNIYMMLDFVPCGTLRDIMNKFPYMEPQMASFYFANLAIAINFLQETGIVHGDVKPDNVLVGLDGYLSLVDFGSSSHLDWKETDGWEERGTIIYQSPECTFPELFPNEIYDNAVDWWALGIVLLEMTVKLVPFWSSDSMATKRNIMKAKYEWPSDIKASNNLKDLIAQLLRKKSRERLGHNIRDVYNHAWLGNINWDKMKKKEYLAPYFPESVDPMERWHKLPLPYQRTVPDLPVVQPPLHLMNDNRYPTKPTF